MRDCIEPCEFFIMNLGAKNGEQMEDIPLYNETTGSGEGYQVFYFPSRVLVNEEKDLYPLLSLAAEVPYAIVTATELLTELPANGSETDA